MTYADDTHAFGEFIRHGGSWGYAAIVARWVEPSTGGRPTTSELSEVSRKVGAVQFARDAAVSDKTVAKYLKAWELAAADGHVPSSASLTPGEHVELDEDELPEWGGYYKRANAKPVDQEVTDKVTTRSGTPKFVTVMERAAADVTVFTPAEVVAVIGEHPDQIRQAQRSLYAVDLWSIAMREALDEASAVYDPDEIVPISEFHCDGDDGFERGYRELDHLVHNLRWGAVTKLRRTQIADTLEETADKVRRGIYPP